MKIVKKNHLASRNIEGIEYIVDTKTSTLHELNETGTFIWEYLDIKDKSFIVEKLITNYDVAGNMAENDFDDFVKSLRQKNLIEINP